MRYIELLYFPIDIPLAALGNGLGDDMNVIVGNMFVDNNASAAESFACTLAITKPIKTNGPDKYCIVW